MLTAGRWAAAVIRVAVASLLGILLLAVLAGGALVVRLTAGPVDATWLAQHAMAITAPEDSIASATLALRREGADRVIHLHLAGLHQQGEEGAAPTLVRSADVSLMVGGLLRGRIEPRAVAVDGLRLNLVREEDGSFPGTGGSGPGVDLAALTDLRLTDARIDVNDLALGRPWQVTAPEMVASQDPDGTLRGHGGLQAQIGGVTATATVDAVRQDGKTTLHAALAPVVPAALAGLSPELSQAAAMDAPVTVTADAALGPDGSLVNAHLHADIGGGTLAVPKKGGGTSPFTFASAALDAEGNVQAVTLRDVHVVVASPSGGPPSTISLAGTVARAAGRLRAQLRLDLDHANIADLPTIWPAGTGAGARPWLTENLTTGNAHDGHFTFTIEGNADGAGLDVTQAAGSIAAEDVTAWWLRPVPPIEHGRADLTLQGPDALVITVREGRLGNIVLRPTSSMRITGLRVHDQDSVIQADLAGPLPDILALLNNPRLNLLSKRPFPVNKPSGSVTARLTINLPLETKVTADQIGIHATAKIADAHLGGVAAGKDLNNANATLDVTTSGLTATGAGLVDRVPAKFDLAMDFTDGPGSQVLQHVTATLHATERELKASGLDPGGVLAGSLAAMLDYSERRDGRATVKLDADLREASVTTPMGWDKQAGSTGHVTVQAKLNHGKITEVDRLQAEAPGLSLEGRSEIQAGKPSILHIDRGIIGRTSATGTVTFPQSAKDPYRVTLSGPRLDLSDQASAAKKTSPEKPSAESGPAYVLDLRFDRVLVGGTRGLGPVSLQADSDGRRIQSAHLASNGPEQLRLDLRAIPGGRHLTAKAADLGALLREAKLATEVDGGEMEVEAQYNDRLASSPLVGTFDLSQFKVQGAPVVGKVLQGMTLYGLVDALRGPGLVFDKLATPFTLSGNLLDVTDARAFSSSLGVTAKGRLDFGQGTVSLDGTVVPAYFFNSLPGRIPLVGRLFSPEKGGGLFAASYGLHGKLSDPSLSLNPLATLTPGALRGIFDIFK